MRAHLIPARLGGLPDASNLVPTPRLLNNPGFVVGHENTLYDMVRAGALVSGPYYWMRALVEYRKAPDVDPRIGTPEDFAAKIFFSYGVTERQGSRWSDLGPLATPDYEVPPPQPSDLIPTRMMK